MKIDLYVQASRNPAIQKNAVARWRICAFAENGTMQEKKDGLVLIPHATSKRVVLMALRDALRRFTKAAVINIYIQDDFVRNMLISNMPNRWSHNEWKKFRYNRDIQHLDLWKEVYELLGCHAVRYATAEDIASSDQIKEMEAKNVRRD